MALYRPQEPAQSATFRFMAIANETYGLSLSTYADLYHWSINHTPEFWSLVWDFTRVIGYKGQHVVDASLSPSSNPPWFLEAKLNWAENLIQPRRLSTKPAVVQAVEPTPEFPDPERRSITYAELYCLVADVVGALKQNGLTAGQTVAAYCSNCIENLVACLAVTAIGAIWVSAASDFGPQGVYERFEQVHPSFIFTVDAVVYNGKVHDHLGKLSVLLSKLSRKPKVVVIHSIPHEQDKSKWQHPFMDWNDFLQQGRESGLGKTPSGEIEWHRGSFNDPLWILFSSGTTGSPKPIVHRAGGMLIQANKEFAICADLTEDDVFFQYTTTGWMMWNFLVSSLSIGCQVILYDGSPLRDPSYLWRLTDELGITVFGTSAKYLDQLSKVYRPKGNHSLKTLRQIYSTGSPLAPALFDFVYEHIHPSVLLASITGGTDICSLFAGMNSALPVYRGEVQTRMLGMAIESFNPEGKPNPPGVSGELVCVKSFPCMPAGFWPLPGYGSPEAVNAAVQRFQQAYFSEFKDVWYHGDHVVITPPTDGNAGGVIMLGRSDGVLNPAGIRFGSSELYQVINQHFTKQIEDSLALGQSVDGGVDEKVILFLKLATNTRLTLEMEQNVKTQIRQSLSARHVPARLISVNDIPYTTNGKLVEVQIKKIINGAPVSIVNRETLRNPECLDEYAEIASSLRAADERVK